LARRLVLADSSNAVYFSDAGKPASIHADNIFVVPTSEPIVAMAAQGTSLLIWTKNSTWHYQPNAGDIVSGGSLQILSDTIGCTSASSVVTGEGYGALYWIDERGCYRTSGKGQLEIISEAIAPFFQDYITNPLTHYYQGEAGAGFVAGQITHADHAQPRTTLRFNPTGVTTTYWKKRDLVLFTVPEMALILGYHQRTKQWTFWSTQSVALNSATTVQVTENIENAWAVADETELYLVGGIETQTLESASRTSGLSGTAAPGTERNTINRSYYILEYGRGGGVDRSVEKGEDHRHVYGKWYEEIGTNPQDHQLILGRPLPITRKTDLGGNETGEDAVWIPVYLVQGVKDHSGSTVDFTTAQLMVTFTFDNTHWEPIFRDDSSSTELHWIAPPERVASQQGWGYGSPVHGSGYQAGRKVSCYSDVSTLSRTGHIVVMSFHPQHATALTMSNWEHFPDLNVNSGQKTLLMYLPFKRKAGTTENYVVGMGMHIIEASIYDASGGTAIGLRVAFWEEVQLAGRQRADNNVAQAVDWAYKTEAITPKDNLRVHSRGLFSQIVSHGKAKNTFRLFPDFFWSGIYNVLMASDQRGWSSQVIDHDRYAGAITTEDDGAAKAVQTAADVRTSGIRTRYKNSSGMQEDTFDNTSKYGGAGANPSADFYIIDDEEVNTIAISDSLKGDSVTYMVFGFIMNKAEKIAIESLKAAFRILKGGRRRHGR